MEVWPVCGCLQYLQLCFCLSLLPVQTLPLFDLAGPPVDVRVERAGKTLPIAEVPNLVAGDRLWIHPAFPADQTARYLLIVAFMRGSTNPPPDAWFTRAETWTKKVHDEGVFVVVPQGAEQAVVFLAPETGGDFSTLRSAVRGRPGSFVRASQDLNQASLDRSRLDKYLSVVRETAQNNPKDLHARSELAARSLSIKLDPKCFDRPMDEQAACLTQHSDDLVLNDGHSQSVVGAALNGSGADLIGALSSTRQAGGGVYSAYVGAIVDTARILDNLHTAQYQYIPALTSPHKEQIDVRLNNPPSFHNPKSVIVIALPPVKATTLPPLRPVERDQVECLQKESLVLPVEGAPLVFSTEFAHETVLHFDADKGQSIDLPAIADPARGGYVLDTHPLKELQLGNEVTGHLRARWGFEEFGGPLFHLRTAQPAKWSVPAEERSALIVGREDKLHLLSPSAACVDSISIRHEGKDGKDGKDEPLTWKQTKPDQIELLVPLVASQAGGLTLLVKQAGLANPDEVPLQTYAEAGHLEQFTISPGDAHGILRGTRLDEVSGLDLDGVHFTSGTLTRSDDSDQLEMNAPNAAATVRLKPGNKQTANITLKDGRTTALRTVISSVRPQLELLQKSIQPAPDSPAAIQITDANEMPQYARISFSMRSKVPEKFARNERIEIANDDGSLHASLTIADGGLTLQDQQTVLANYDPQKAFGASAFGALKVRAVSADEIAGDWQPLITLVRVPALQKVECPPNAIDACTLTGTSLFLIDSVAAAADFSDKVSVAEGFVAPSLKVPHPAADGTLFIRLRDDPTVVDRAVLPVTTARP